MSGPGRGNWGHTGRPGKVGGSVSKNAGGPSPTSSRGDWNVSRRETNYHGIKEVSFAPQGTTDAAIIQKNKEVIDHVISRVPASAVKGLNELYVTGGGGFLGSAVYIPVDRRPGYASDSVLLMDGWIAKDFSGKANALAHELGHRYQLMNPELVKKFEKTVNPQIDHLKGIFPDHWENYTKYRSKTELQERITGEVFAESFARHVLKDDKFKNAEAPANFWSEVLKD
jgi:hypothetical protein